MSAAGSVARSAFTGGTAEGDKKPVTPRRASNLGDVTGSFASRRVMSSVTVTAP